MRRRRAVRLAAVALVVLGAGPVAGQALGQADVVGQVESTLGLQLTPTSSGGVRATVDATVDDTTLSVTRTGHPASVLARFPGSVSRKSVAVPSGGDDVVTITFGPNGP